MTSPHAKASSTQRRKYWKTRLYFCTLIRHENRVFQVIFQKRVQAFHRGFKHEKTYESTRPQAECFYCSRVFETPMKHEERVFEITSLTKEKN